MFSGRTVVYLLLAGVLLVGAYAVVPAILEGYVARDVQGRLGLSETPEVDLTSDPAPLMFLGQFSGGRVVLPAARAGNVRPDEVAIDLDPFDVDVLGSLSSGTLRTEEPITGDLRVELSEAEVNRIASSRVTAFSITGVDLREGSVLVRSEASAFGVSVPVGIEGRVEARDGSLVFLPYRAQALGTTLPEELSGPLLDGTSFVYPLGEQFGGSMVTGVELRENQAILTGELGELPVG